MSRRALALVLVLTACAQGPEPTPYRGSAPARLLLLPQSGEVAISRAEQDALDTVLHELLVARGYSVVPVAVAAVALRGRDAEPELGWAALASEFDADALLVREAQWREPSDPAHGAALELAWRIVEGGSLAPIWSAELRVPEGTIVEERLTGPDHAIARDPLLADEPVRGRGQGDLRRVIRATTPLALAEFGQARLLERLPRGAARGR